MRAWRSSQGLLVETGVSQHRLVSTLWDALPPGPWRSLFEHALVGPDGDVERRYGVVSWSVDDELGASVHAVVDGALRELNITLRRTVDRSEVVVIAGLEAVGPADEASWATIDGALRKDRAKSATADAERARAAATRLAAVARALEDFDAGPDLRRAQELLRARIETWGGALEASLLRVLGRFGELPRPVRESIRPALDAYVAACRAAAFDPSLSRDPAYAHPASPPPQNPMTMGLCEDLERVQAELWSAADGQDSADASSNAAAYRWAAEHVGRSLAHLRPERREP